MTIEGSWQVTKGVFERLKSRGVEDSIKDLFWSNQVTDPNKQRSIWQFRAPAGVQVPYVVYSVPTDTLIGQHSGTGSPVTVAGQLVTKSAQSVQIRQMLIRFMAHVAVRQGIGFDTAVRACGFVADAIEDGKLCFSEATRFITLTRQPDIQARDDDDHAVAGVEWIVEYEVIVNAARLQAE